MGVDESTVRGGRHLLTAAIASSSHLGQINKSLRKLLLPDQSRAHAAKDGRRFKCQFATALGSLDVRGITFVARKDAGTGDKAIRRALVFALIEHLAEDPPDLLVFERRSAEEDRRDHDSLALAKAKFGVHVPFEHYEPDQTPLLWIADLAAWCIGRGDDWPGKLPVRMQVIRHIGRV